MCIDSAVQHGFTFTHVYASALAEAGAVCMPLGEYGFSRQFAWINDRYGVSWQLNLT